MRNVFLISSFGLLAVVSACGKKDNKATETFGGFVTPSTFSSVTPTALTVDEVKGKLNTEADLFDNAPTSTSALNDTTSADPSTDPSTDPTGLGSGVQSVDKCFEKNSPKAKVVNKETINVTFDLDASSCLQTEIATATKTAANPANTLKAKFVVNVTCPGVDLSSLDGKSIDELGFDKEASTGLPGSLEEKCKDLPSVKLFFNSDFDFALTLPYGNTSIRFAQKSKSALMTKDGSACEMIKVDGGYKSNGCLTATLMEGEMPSDMSNPSSAAKKSVDLTVLESVNLVDSTSATAKWFGGGSIKATFNNFSGTVTYTDATTAPTYALTAPGGLEAKGTLAPVAFTGALAREQSLTTESVKPAVSKIQPRIYLKGLMPRLALH